MRDYSYVDTLIFILVRVADSGNRKILTMAKYDALVHLKSMEPLHAKNLFGVAGKVAVVTGGSRGAYQYQSQSAVHQLYAERRRSATGTEILSRLNFFRSSWTNSQGVSLCCGCVYFAGIGLMMCKTLVENGAKV